MVKLEGDARDDSPGAHRRHRGSSTWLSTGFVDTGQYRFRLYQSSPHERVPLYQVPSASDPSVFSQQPFPQHSDSLQWALRRHPHYRTHRQGTKHNRLAASKPLTTVFKEAEVAQLIDQAGFTVWHRDHLLPWAANSEEATSRATEACDNYMILLSSQALQDTLCLQGLLFALSMHKRIVPVQVEALDPARLPEPLQTIPRVNLRQPQLPLSQSDGGHQLLHRLRHQAEYHRWHTQLLLKALTWERQGRSPALLLKGQELCHYHQWTHKALLRTTYHPLQLQVLYVAESLNQSPLRPLSQAEARLTRAKTWLSQLIG
nr:TIR domain-containing protein [Nodosilinea sp. P-1105]